MTDALNQTFFHFPARNHILHALPHKSGPSLKKSRPFMKNGTQGHGDFLWGCKEAGYRVQVGLPWDCLSEANRPEDLVEVDWALVLVPIEPSKDNSSISSAIDDLSCSRSLRRNATSHDLLDVVRIVTQLLRRHHEEIAIGNINTISLLASSKYGISVMDWIDNLT
jgi:hypothetical protein